MYQLGKSTYRTEVKFILSDINIQDIYDDVICVGVFTRGMTTIISGAFDAGEYWKLVKGLLEDSPGMESCIEGLVRHECFE